MNIKVSKDDASRPKLDLTFNKDFAVIATNQNNKSRNERPKMSTMVNDTPSSMFENNFITEGTSTSNKYETL